MSEQTEKDHKLPVIEPVPFFLRIWLATICFFRVLFDGLFARQVQNLRRLTSVAAPVEPPQLSEQAPLASGVGEQIAVDTQALAEAGAIQLLAMLQREGRLIDFLREDVTSFPDADVGAAARLVHQGCKKALDEHLVITPVRAEAEGSKVAVSKLGPHVKLIGDVRGSLPFNGTLRHGGWQVTKMFLPVSTAAPMVENGATVQGAARSEELHIIAPAEVEL